MENILKLNFAFQYEYFQVSGTLNRISQEFDSLTVVDTTGSNHTLSQTAVLKLLIELGLVK